MMSVIRTKSTKTVETFGFKDKEGRNRDSRKTTNRDSRKTTNRDLRKTTKVTIVVYFKKGLGESLTCNISKHLRGNSFEFDRNSTSQSILGSRAELSVSEDQAENVRMTKPGFLRKIFGCVIKHGSCQSLGDSGICADKCSCRSPNSLLEGSAKSLNCSQDEGDTPATGPYFKDKVQLFSDLGDGYLRYYFDKETKRWCLDTKGSKQDTSTVFYWCRPETGPQDSAVLVIADDNGCSEIPLCVAYDKTNRSLTLKECVMNESNVQAPDEAKFVFTLVDLKTKECQIRLLSSYQAEAVNDVQSEWYLGAFGNGEAKLRNQIILDEACYSDPGTVFYMYNKGS